MMKNKSRLLTVILVFTFLISLMSGCKLAIKDSKEVAATNHADLFCGVFVTKGSQGDTAKIYEGVVNEVGIAEFKGLKGYFLGIRQSIDSNGDSVEALVADKVFNSCSNNVFCRDDNKQTNSYEANIYLNSDFRSVFRLNSVYQRPNKTYYCLLGSGALVNGTDCSLSISNGFKSEFNGKTIERKNEFKVNFKYTDETQKVMIKEINAKDQVIKTTEISKNAPEVFLTQNDTSYLIVVEIYKNGKNKVKRSIYSMDNTKTKETPITHELYYPSQDGFMIKKIIEFR